MVSSSSPISSRKPSTRPIWSSVCDRNAAKHSMKRAATARSSGSRSSHAGTQCGRGDSSVDGGEQPELLLAGEGALAPDVPALVERAAVARPPLLGRVVRRVARAGGEVQVEGRVGLRRAEGRDHGDGLVGEVLGEVVALGGGAGRAHRGVVAEEVRDELVGLAAVEAVPVPEAATAGPRVARRGEVDLVLGREVPLADRDRDVAVRAEDLGEEAVLARDDPVVARGTRRRGRRRAPCRSSGGCDR